jgi:hypothetical protein
VDRSPDSRASTMSTASRNNKVPPAILNADTLIPSSRRSQSPASANTMKIPAEIATDFQAIRVR